MTATRKRYRVTFSLNVDVWASDRDEAVKLCLDQLMDDGVPWFVAEWLTAETWAEDGERDPGSCQYCSDPDETVNWNTINDEEEE